MANEIINGQAFFANTNYDDNPQEGIILETIPEQKNATHTVTSDGELVCDPWESFRTNNGKMGYPNVATVNGMDAGDIVFGEGVVLVDNSGN